jgi:hypothetical protein
MTESDPSRSLAPHSCGDAKSALPTASMVGSVLGLRTKPMRRREFISRERIEADIARPFTAATRCPSLRAPWRRMILNPRLGAHVLCFELSDERSETRWERCRECVRPVRHEAALGCCGGHEAAFPLLLGC